MIVGPVELSVYVADWHDCMEGIPCFGLSLVFFVADKRCSIEA